MDREESGMLLKQIGSFVIADDVIIVFHVETHDAYYYRYQYWAYDTYCTSLEIIEGGIKIVHTESHNEKREAIYLTPNLESSKDKDTEETEFVHKILEICSSHRFERDILNGL